MTGYKRDGWNRRQFLQSAALTGTAALVGLRPEFSLAAEPPPETTRLRLLQLRPACWAPQYVAEDLLREEGFTDVQFIKGKSSKHGDELRAAGELDMSMVFSARMLKDIQPGDSTVFLSGLHAGCYALIGSDRVRSIQDLKGKTVWAFSYKASGPHIFFSTIVAYVGLDPVKDINYAWVSKSEAINMFEKGELDAFMSFAPEPQELRAKNIGNVLVDTNVDRPWSQYFCCMIVGNRDFVERNPIATRRALRAILKANDICSRNPELAARILINKGVRKEAEHDIIVQALKEIPYAQWRKYNHEDTIRFYSLRMRDAGLIDSNPKQIIAQNTNWSFLEELRENL